MKPVFSVALVLALAPLAHANDSAFEAVGGSFRPAQGENKAIRMVRETVVLTAQADSYTTRAEFIFENESARPQVVKMGYPEGNSGDVDTDKALKTTTFERFATFVDGQKTPATRTTLRNYDKAGFNTYWIKTVSFAPGQTRRVRVETTSPYGGAAWWGFTRALAYSFTGGNWRGNVGSSVLEVRLTRAGLWRVVPQTGDGKNVPMTLKSTAQGAVFRHEWKNWPAQLHMTIGLERVVPFWRHDASGNDGSESTLQAVAGAQTVRIGTKPDAMEPATGFPADGFMHDNVFYVRVGHLENKLGSWGAEQKPELKTNLSFSPSAGFALTAGRTRIEGRAGATTARINGRSVELSAPILGVSQGGTRQLYVPLAPLAKTLGWKYALRGERLFTLERGSWRG